MHLGCAVERGRCPYDNQPRCCVTSLPFFGITIADTSCEIGKLQPILSRAKRQPSQSADRRAADPNTDANANDHSSNGLEYVPQDLTVQRRDPSRRSTHK